MNAFSLSEASMWKHLKRRTVHVRISLRVVKGNKKKTLSAVRLLPPANWGDLNPAVCSILRIPAANWRSTADITTFVAWSPWINGDVTDGAPQQSQRSERVEGRTRRWVASTTGTAWKQSRENMNGLFLMILTFSYWPFMAATFTTPEGQLTAMGVFHFNYIMMTLEG